MDSNNQKSKADVLIEKLDEELIKNGFPPTEMVNKKGSVVIISPKDCDKLKKQQEKEKNKKKIEELKKQIIIADEEAQKAKRNRFLIWLIVCSVIVFGFMSTTQQILDLKEFIVCVLGSIFLGAVLVYILLMVFAFTMSSASIEFEEDRRLNALKKELEKELKKNKE